MKLIDISLTIEDHQVVYPRNPSVRITRVSEASKKSAALSLISFGSHTSTHMDAPRHISKKKKGVDTVSLAQCYGPCIVLDMRPVPFGSGILPEHFMKSKIKKNDIVLLKTKNSDRGFTTFYKDFVYLTAEGAKYLLKKKVKGVGIDSLSIQRYRTKFHAAHGVLLKNNKTIIEGLSLKKVKKGRYTFVGFPLKIKDGDGSPLRAVLLT